MGEGEAERDFKLTREGASVTFIYPLNLLTTHATNQSPLSLLTLDQYLKGIEAKVKQWVGRVSLSITEKDICRSVLCQFDVSEAISENKSRPKHYVEDKYGDRNPNLKFFLRFRPPADLLQRLKQMSNKRSRDKKIPLFSLHSETTRCRIDAERLSHETSNILSTHRQS